MRIGEEGSRDKIIYRRLAQGRYLSIRIPFTNWRKRWLIGWREV